MVCQYAVNGGHLEVLKCTRENGFPWDENIYITAAARGHLKCLIWATENECPWDPDHCRHVAITWNRSNIVKLIDDNKFG
jgi:hypothetical protein